MDIQLGGEDGIRAGYAAYASQEDASATVRASQLICIAVFLSGDLEQIEEVEEWADLLGVPKPRPLAESNRALSLARVRSLSMEPARRARTERSSDTSASIWLETHSLESVEDPVLRLWQNARGYRSSRAALSLLILALDDPNELVRAVAAASLHVLHPIENRTVDAALDNATTSSRRVIREVAEAAISIDSVSDDIDAAERDKPVPYEKQEPVSLIVHGTFARLVGQKDRWYDPQAALPRRIRDEVSPDLYTGRDYFRWDAAYSAAGRKAGAERLLRWCRRRGISKFENVYAHSHGGNIVMSAAAEGLQIDLLVLLHVPILRRKPEEWQRIDRNVGHVFDLRTPLDLVVLVDGLRTGSRNGFKRRKTQLSSVSRPTPPLNQIERTSHTRYVEDRVWEDLALTSDVIHERTYL